MRRLRNALLHRRDVVSARLLVNILEKADPVGLVHSVAVAEISSMIAKRHRIGADIAGELWLAALLHDIGNLGIPKDILSKKKPSISDRRYFEKHVTIGKFMVDQFFSGGALGRSIKAHHEQFDGNGYPDAMEGKEIPLYARVIAIADYYDTARSAGWLLTHRSHDQVMKEIQDEAGKRFDPEIVAAAVKASPGINLVHEQVHGISAEKLRRWL